MKTLALLLVLGLARLGATDITTTMTWSVTLSASDLSGGAGTNVPSILTSSSSVTQISLANTLSSVLYHVYAHVQAVTWPAGSTLWVRRTSDGTALLGLSTISGGTNYIALSTVDQEIFVGLLDRSGIAMQYKIDGLSLAVAPATYSVNVVYTVLPP
jgi:hypothetical protein